MALRDCLSDWIGLRGTCTDESPGSGLYINDLPKIDVGFMENLTNSESETFKDVWEKVELRGLNTFGSECKQLLRQSLDFPVIRSSVQTGIWDSEGTTVKGNTKYYGYRIEARQSKYLALYLTSILFYSDSSVSIPIRVFDLSSGVTLYTNNFAVTEGVNILNINTEFDLSTGEGIFIAFLQTLAYESIPVTEGIVPNQGRNFFDINWGMMDSTAIPVEKNFTGADIDNYGMIINYNLLCSMDNYLCQNRGAISTALWYWLGYEFMQEWLAGWAGKNINFDTLQDPDLIRNWRDGLKGMAQKELKNVLGSIEPEYDGICFECNPIITGTYYLP